MSTESETKSAGVPAGATHVCTKCGQYWKDHRPLTPWTEHTCCTEDMRPISEAGPAPTTAAPAEQLSGKVVEGQPPRECALCDTTEVNGVNINECSSCLTLCCTAHSEDADNQRVLCINCAPEDEPVPAEQPGKADEGDHADDCTDSNCHKRHTIPAGKAADPRPAQPPAFMGGKPEDDGQPYCGFCGKLLIQHGDNGECPAQPQAPVQTYHADAPEHLTISSAFGSVQPQAPAEPTQEQLDAADAWCESLPGQGDLVELLAQYAEHVAAPLREERDRLARELAGALEDAAKGRMCDVEQHASRIHYGTEDNERLRTDLMAERAKVAERDARIATLTARAEGALALAETYRKAWRAALGAPEGQPPAPPQELLGKEGAGAAPPRKAPQEGPMAHFAALADQDCEHGMEAIGETCSAESASRDEGNEEDYPFQYWCGPCIAKAVGFKPSPVRIQRARVLAESAPSSPEEQLSGKELK